MQVSINGRTVEVPDGCNVSVRNGVLYVNGVRQDGDVPNDFRIIVAGPVGSITADRGSVTVEGDCGPVSASGSVSVGKIVQGDVDAGGSVTCGNVLGHLTAGGSVTVGGSVGGDVRAGGSLVVNGRTRTNS